MRSECFSCNYIIEDEESSQLQLTVDVQSSGETNATCPQCGEELTIVHGPAQSLHEETVDAMPVAFAHFQLQRILGRGGFGTVWLARDTTLDRQVAIKLPLRKSGESFDLLREARTAAKLRHVNLVSVFEVGTHRDQPFVVCEYIEGCTLREWIRRSDKGTLPIKQVCALLRAICEGLQHAHEMGVVHRDMKPANVLMDADQKPLVTDFGLAKNVNIEESISSRSRIVGTIAYMAPEQAGTSSEEVDHRADIYAVGVIMFEMLTGERPFRGNVQALLAQKLQEDPQPPRRLRPNVPHDLETICLKCLQRKPGRRYQSLRELIDELDRFQSGRPILARPVSKFEHVRRWAIRNPMISGLLFAFLSVLVTGLLSTSFFWMQAAHQSDIANRSLYASKIRLADNNYAAGDLYAAHNALKRLAEPIFDRYRGFEWYYLQSKLRLIRCTVQHGKSIAGVAISRDGNWFATLSEDRMVKIWHGETGKLIREMAAQTGRWQSIAISHRDDRLALGCKDGTIHLYPNVSNLDQIPSIVKHGPPVAALKFSRNGRWLFSAGISGAIRKWRVDDLKLVREIPTGKGGCEGFDVSRQGDHLAVIDHERTLRIWNTETETKTFAYLVQTDLDQRSIAMSHDGQNVAVGSYSGHVKIYDTEAKQPIDDFDCKTGWIGDLDFVGQTNYLAMTSAARDIIIYDVDQKQEVRRYRGGGSADAKIALSANARHTVMGSRNGQAIVLDTSNHRKTIRHQLAQPARQTLYLNDDRVIVQLDDGSVAMIDLSDRTSKLFYQATEANSETRNGRPVRPVMTVNHERTVLALADPRGTLSLWSLKVDEVPVHLDVDGGDVISMAMDSAGRQLMVSVADGPMLYFPHARSAAGHKPTGNQPRFEKVPLPKEQLPPRRLHWNTTEDQCFAGFGNGLVRVWDAEKNRWSRAHLDCDSYPISLDCDDEMLYVGSRDGFLYCCDVRTLELVWSTKVCPVQLNAIKLIPQSETIAVVGRQGHLQFWDSVNGEVKLALGGDRNVQAFSVDAATDGQLVVTGDLNGEIKFWEGIRQK